MHGCLEICLTCWMYEWQYNNDMAVLLLAIPIYNQLIILECWPSSQLYIIRSIIYDVIIPER